MTKYKVFKKELSKNLDEYGLNGTFGDVVPGRFGYKLYTEYKEFIHEWFNPEYVEYYCWSLIIKNCSEYFDLWWPVAEKRLQKSRSIIERGKHGIHVDWFQHDISEGLFENYDLYKDKFNIWWNPELLINKITPSHNEFYRIIFFPESKISEDRYTLFEKVKTDYVPWDTHSFTTTFLDFCFKRQDGIKILEKYKHKLANDLPMYTAAHFGDEHFDYWFPLARKKYIYKMEVENLIKYCPRNFRKWYNANDEMMFGVVQENVVKLITGIPEKVDELIDSIPGAENKIEFSKSPYNIKLIEILFKYSKKYTNLIEKIVERLDSSDIKNVDGKIRQIIDKYYTKKLLKHPEL